ncbi:NAD(P)/FAD-dependent oxidoreductase [Natronosalvus rutilus]|uniref:FAD-binding oxidoreductase n=1 Tax=Natronosalvus rutilus TaxID=2953753 RepID=A0A9E7ND05_9EURY|nr:FAD-dependent oxidoreductase [Natronosalvus rutilus]UTF55650.1 FAD-binding oxidoreductase [Natronosalvus rutilus]
MRTESEDRDVIVIGGGVVGCAIAHELASDHEVLILEKGQVASGATALAAGIIGLTNVYDDVPTLAGYVASFFEAFDGTGDFQYTKRARVGLVRPEDESRARREAKEKAEQGVKATYLNTPALREKYPRFDTSEIVGAVEYGARPGEGWLDPYTFAVTLKREAEAAGVEFRTGTVVTDIDVADGAVTGVKTESGTIRAPTVVVASGWRTPGLLSDLMTLPVRPYQTQCIVLKPERRLNGDVPMGWVSGEHIYFRPEANGHLLVGGWSFAIDDPVAASSDASEEFRQHVATVIPDVFDGMDRAKFVNGWAGVDAATPDQRPIVDASDEGPEGLIVATGFHGRGVMTSPAAARAVRSLLTDEDAPFSLEPFSLDRFDSRSPDFEFRSISDH